MRWPEPWIRLQCGSVSAIRTIRDLQENPYFLWRGGAAPQKIGIFLSRTQSNKKSAGDEPSPAHGIPVKPKTYFAMPMLCLSRAQGAPLRRYLGKAKISLCKLSLERSAGQVI
jgi:hypothetical protein